MVQHTLVQTNTAIHHFQAGQARSQLSPLSHTHAHVLRQYVVIALGNRRGAGAAQLQKASHGSAAKLYFASLCNKEAFCCTVSPQGIKMHNKIHI